MHYLNNYSVQTTMQTKQQTVTNFLNKQAQARNTQYGVMNFMVDATMWMLLATPITIAFAGFCGAFDALL
jgi:ABC-type phosphate transport system permease subunit